MKKSLLMISVLALNQVLSAAPLCKAVLAHPKESLENSDKQSPSVEDLLKEYRSNILTKGSSVLSADRLSFVGVGNRDVYNIARPVDTKFQGQATRIMFARVEPRENHDSEVWAFAATSKSETEYAPIEGLPHFKMEDPFFSQIGGELFVGGVETFPRSERSGDLGYRTVFYRDHGRGVEYLERFLVGPVGMKDIRFAQMKNGKIIISGRPQNENPALGGRGKNSQATVANVDEISAQVIADGKIISGQVNEKDWIGTNEIHLLENGQIGFLSHVAHYEEGSNKNRGYFISVYTSNNLKPQIILERNDLPGGLADALERNASKRPDLVNVLFGGGLERLANGLAYLYIGAGDAESWRVLVRDPFVSSDLSR